jgi:hypothetical protein
MGADEPFPDAERLGSAADRPLGATHVRNQANPPELGPGDPEDVGCSSNRHGNHYNINSGDAFQLRVEPHMDAAITQGCPDTCLVPVIAENSDTAG